jgi:uncharacterized protein (DUF2147 family)
MKNYKLLTAICLVLLFAASPLMSQINKNDIQGIWLNQDEDARIEIFERSNKFYGKLVWLKEPIDTDTGKPKLDKNNPDDKLKLKPLQGKEILTGFSFDGRKEWKGGEIYDPKNGKTYSCYMVLENKNNLKIRGFIGVSLLGRTTYWTRVE